MSSLNGKVAIVTGASKGIGAGIAKSLGAAGASVIVNYSSSKEGADRVVAEIVKHGGKATAVQADVSKADDLKRLFAETKKVYGTLDVLVNNAGIFKMDPVEAVTEEEFHRQFNTNVLGLLLSIKESVNYFGPDGGSIVNLTSIVSVNAFPSSSIYSATKASVDSITRVLAAELAPKKIRVNAVAPGMTETEGANDLIKTFPAEMVTGIVQSIPLGRLGQPDDIAKVVLFMASDDSSWITGDRITASGGQR